MTVLVKARAKDNGVIDVTDQICRSTNMASPEIPAVTDAAMASAEVSATGVK